MDEWDDSYPCSRNGKTGGKSKPGRKGEKEFLTQQLMKVNDSSNKLPYPPFVLKKKISSVLESADPRRQLKKAHLVSSCVPHPIRLMLFLYSLFRHQHSSQNKMSELECDCQWFCQSGFNFSAKIKSIKYTHIQIYT